MILNLVILIGLAVLVVFTYETKLYNLAVLGSFCLGVMTNMCL